MAVLDFLAGRLEALRANGIWREDDAGSARERAMESARALGVEFVDASSNDYLNYANHGSDVSRETLSVQVNHQHRDICR